jgi:hypothetical protein
MLRSRSLWQWYISTNIMFLDVIHHPFFSWKHHLVYFSKHDVSETGFCFRLQVKPTQLVPIDRASPYFMVETSIISLNHWLFLYLISKVSSCKIFQPWNKFSMQRLQIHSKFQEIFLGGGVRAVPHGSSPSPSFPEKTWSDPNWRAKIFIG